PRETAGTAADDFHAEPFRWPDVEGSERHDGAQRIDRARALIPGDPAAAVAAAARRATGSEERGETRGEQTTCESLTEFFAADMFQTTRWPRPGTPARARSIWTI